MATTLTGTHRILSTSAHSICIDDPERVDFYPVAVWCSAFTADQAARYRNYTHVELDAEGNVLGLTGRRVRA